ncbi:MAG: hypothetical protein ACR2QG_04795 [Gammaproteobacteria bacterium]
MASPEDFENNRYIVEKAFLDENVVRFLESYYLATMSRGKGHLAHDKTSINSYGEACADTLLYAMREKMEKITGLPLNPGFSFVRLYRKGEKLRRHIDRGANEVNCTIQIHAPIPWALGLEVEDKEIHVTQDDGDALIYHGLENPHWRDEYSGNQHLQLILAYVIRGGEHDSCSFDGRGGPFYKPDAARMPFKRKLLRMGSNLKRRLTGQPPLK